MIAHSADRWSRDGLFLDGAVREWLANCFATHLLTPREWFLSDCQSLDFDLWELKHRYETASHEVIALRTLESDTPAVVTIFDNGKQSKRLGNLCYRVPIYRVLSALVGRGRRGKGKRKFRRRPRRGFELGRFMRRVGRGDPSNGVVAEWED